MTSEPLPSPAEIFVTTGDGLRLWSEAFGRPGDPAVLLIMGAMNQGIFWPEDFCRELAGQGRYVIRYDHRDTGRSGKVDYASRPYTLDELTDDALAVLRAHGLARTSVVGLSMGGYIAQLLAARHPAVVDKLVLISTTADHRPYMAATLGQPCEAFTLPPPGSALLDYLRESAAHPPQTAEELEANLLAGWALTYGGPKPVPFDWLRQTLRLAATRDTQPMSAFNHALAVAASPDRLALLSSIQAPTRIIHGRHDILLPPAHAEVLAGGIRGAYLQWLDMGHSFMGASDSEILAAMTAIIR